VAESRYKGITVVIAAADAGMVRIASDSAGRSRDKILVVMACRRSHSIGVGVLTDAAGMFGITAFGARRFGDNVLVFMACCGDLITLIAI